LVAAERDDLDEALAHVEGALSLDQDFGLGWSSLGVVCERRGDLDEAEAAYVRALAIDPGLATPRRNLALLLLRRERFAEARAHLSRLAAVDPDDLEAHAHLAWSELRLRRPRAALDRASAILEREPGHPRALMVRGAARARLGDLDAAAEDLFRAARTRELRVAALARLLLVMHLRGDVTEARRVAAVLAREGGDDPAAVFALAQHARENE
jgi:Flp pilus assembly protein TadD